MERADPKASLVERVRGALARKQLDGFAELRAEYGKVCEHIARLEALLAAKDPDFHGPDRAALGAMVGRPTSALD